jgi:hypothetical protein
MNQYFTFLDCILTGGAVMCLDAEKELVKAFEIPKCEAKRVYSLWVQARYLVGYGAE